MSDTERVCTNCAWCVHSGTGYSEYTILGEDLICTQNVRESIDTEFLKPEEVEAMNKVAAECPHFVEGSGPRLGLYTDDSDKDWADWEKQTGLRRPEGH